MDSLNEVETSTISFTAFSVVRHQTPKLGGHVLIGGMLFVNHMVLVEIKAQLLMTILIKKVLNFMYVSS
jgi:hypothetical protein